MTPANIRKSMTSSPRSPVSILASHCCERPQRSAAVPSRNGLFLDLLMQARSKMGSVRIKRSGVPILDRFAARLAERTNEYWAKWQVCRYAEIAAEFMCYGITQIPRLGLRCCDPEAASSADA